MRNDLIDTIIFKPVDDWDNYSKIDALLAELHYHAGDNTEEFEARLSSIVQSYI